MQGDVLETPNPHPELQSFEPRQPPHALAIHDPAFAAQQDPDPEIPEPWPGVRELPDAQPQRRRILGVAPAIPRSPTELREPTRAADGDLERRVKPLRQPPPPCGRQLLRPSASASMCLSSVRSATSRFSSAFSSSSCRTRRTSFTPRCP